LEQGYYCLYIYLFRIIAGKINKVSEESIKDYENNGGILLSPINGKIKDAATDMNQL